MVLRLFTDMNSKTSVLRTWRHGATTLALTSFTMIGACSQAGPASASAAGNVGARQHNPLGFSVQLPPGWRVQARDLRSIDIVSPDGGSAVLIRGRVVTGGLMPWVTQRFLQGESWASRWQLQSSRQLQPGVAQAAFRVELKEGGTRQLSMLGVGGGLAMNTVATIWAAIAPVERYAQDLPTLAAILGSFKFEQASAAGYRPGGSGGGRNAPPQLAFRSWVDPNENSFAVELPADWQVQGGTVRPDTTGTRTGLMATAPGGRHVLWIGDVNLPRLFVQPGPGMASLSPYLQPGQSNNILPLQDAPTFATGWVQQHFGQAQATKVQELPDVVQRNKALAQMAGSPQARFSAATVELRLADGREGAVTAIIGMQPSVADSAMWWVAGLSGFVSAGGESAIGATALAHALQTYRVNPVWYMQEQHLTREAADQMLRAQQESTAQQAQTTSERWAGETRVAEGRGDVLAGQTRLVDPETGERFTTEAGSRYYYRDLAAERNGPPTGQGQDIDFNPAPGDFRRLLEVQADGSAR